MADAVLTMKLSRRTILAGGVSAGLPAAVGSAAAPAGVFGPDAALLRRIAAAAGLWDDYTAASEHCARLFAVLRRHPDWPADPYTDAGCRAAEVLAVRSGTRAADDECERIYERHEAALRSAFAIPALSLPGLHAKLRYGLKAAKDRDGGTWEESDYRWLDIAMADLDRAVGVS